MTRDEIEAKLRKQIANGEITPEQAEAEYDLAVNGMDSFESIYGW